MARVGDVGQTPQWESSKPIKGSPKEFKTSSANAEPIQPPSPLTPPEGQEGKIWLKNCLQWLAWAHERVLKPPVPEETANFINQLNTVLHSKEFLSSMNQTFGSDKTQLVKDLITKAGDAANRLGMAEDFLEKHGGDFGKLSLEDQEKYSKILVQLDNKLYGPSGNDGVAKIINQLIK